MAQIQIWTRDVNGTKVLGNYAPQHTFLIKINDNGTREILRGGPINDNMIIDDITIVNKPYDKSSISSDYFDPELGSNPQNYQGTTIKTSSQSEIDNLWNKAWNKAQNINSQKYDYEPLTQNCNTTTSILAEEMGLFNEVKNFLNQKDVWTPGFGKPFEHSLVDKASDFATEFPANLKANSTEIKNWIDDFINSRDFQEIGSVNIANIYNKISNFLNSNTTNSQDFKYYLKKDLESKLQMSLTDQAFEKILKDGQYFDLDKYSNIAKEAINKSKVSNNINKINISTDDDLVTYKIQSGDSLSAIALRSGVSVDNILALNPQITDPNKIKAGSTIILKDNSDIKLNINDETYLASTKSYNNLLQDNKLLKDYKLEVNQDLFNYKNSQGQEYTIIKDSPVTLSDNTTALLSSIIKMTQTAKEFTIKFVDGYMREVKDLFTTGDGMASLINDVSAGIEKGLAPEQIAKIVATKLVVKNAMSKIKNEFILNDSDKALLNQGKEISELSTEGQQALSNFAVNHPIYNTAYLAAASFATTLLLNMNEGWDRREYTIAAVESTAQAAAQTAIAIAISKGWLSMSSSAGAGVGAAVAYMISASVKDIFADDHMNSHQWQSTIVSAGIIGVAAFAGTAMAITLIGSAFAGPIGAAVATIIVSQFMGGKEFKEGEYPDPYDFIKIEAKEDGTGNRIIGINPEGVVAIAREYYHDDIYGTNGSDNLVGKSGTNTIVGYGGNDHIEGRGGKDVLIGGSGDDVIIHKIANDNIMQSKELLSKTFF